MTTTRNMTAADVRSEVGHPIIDADGHFMEFMPLLNDEVLTYLEEVGGAALRDRFRAHALKELDTAVFEADRSVPAVVDGWRSMPSWWGNPVSDPRDRATAHLPSLMYDRLEELGIDFMLIYPSWTLGFLMSTDDELRAPTCRATNRYFATLFAPYRDRLEPGALIPMQNPDEAVDEIDFAVQELGLQVGGAGRSCISAGGTEGRTSGGFASRCLRPRQPLRLRPGLGGLRTEQGRSRIPQLLAAGASGTIDHQLRVQPRERDRRGP